MAGPQVDPALPAALARLAEATGFPFLADPLSGCRCGPHDRSRVVGRGDLLCRPGPWREAHAPDLVIRFGAIPTSKPLMALVEDAAPDQLVVDGDGGYREPALLPTTFVHADAAITAAALVDALAAIHGPAFPQAHAWLDGWLAADRAADAALRAWLAAVEERGEAFEGAPFAHLGDLLPDGAILWAGSSMPVRDLDAWLPGSPRGIRPLANRGANGIDGVVSSALGAAAAGVGHVALVVGDLSFLHDLNALVAARLHGLSATIVLVNNDGGGIFSFLPQAATDAPGRRPAGRATRSSSGRPTASSSVRSSRRSAQSIGRSRRAGCGPPSPRASWPPACTCWSFARNEPATSSSTGRRPRPSPPRWRSLAREQPGAARGRGVTDRGCCWAPLGSASGRRRTGAPAAPRVHGEWPELDGRAGRGGDRRRLPRDRPRPARPRRDGLARGHRPSAGDPDNADDAADPGDPSRAAIERIADDLVELLRALGHDRANVVGYSMGARVALRMAISHPACVRSLVLEAPSAGIEDPAERTARRAADDALARTLERDGIELFVDAWERTPVLAGEAGLAPPARSTLREIRLSHDPSGLAASLRAAGQGAMEPLHDRLAEVTAPTLVIVGADDPVRARAAAVAAGVPGARLAVIEGAAHAPHLEAPDPFCRLVLDFLKEDRVA